MGNHFCYKSETNGKSLCNKHDFSKSDVQKLKLTTNNIQYTYHSKKCSHCSITWVFLTEEKYIATSGLKVHRKYYNNHY